MKGRKYIGRGRGGEKNLLLSFNYYFIFFFFEYRKMNQVGSSDMKSIIDWVNPWRRVDSRKSTGSEA